MAKHDALRTAIAHMTISDDVHINGDTIRRLMEEAASAGAHLIQFPEAALSGYCKQQIKHWQDVDWPALQNELELIAATAKQLKIWTVVGSAHRLTEPHLPHNSLYVISNKGALHARYDKRLISYTEMHGWYSPGKEPVTFRVNGIKIGLALCLEIQFPEIFAEYRDLGVDLVLLSAYAAAPSRFDLLAQAHAEINNIWIGFSTPINTWDDPPMPSSLVGVGPDCSIQATTKAGKEGLAIADIEPSDPIWDVPINKARPWRKIAREGEVYRERYVEDARSRNLKQF